MSERLEMQLEVVPGLVKAAWTVLPGKVTGGSRSKGELNASAPAQEQQADRPLSEGSGMACFPKKRNITKSGTKSRGSICLAARAFDG